VSAPKHTKGPWRLGGAPSGRGSMAGTAVVADHPVPGIGGSDAVDYYGGHLVAESIAAQNLHVIAAAPEMYDFIDTLENDDGAIPAWLWHKRELLLAKARGEE